MEQSLTTWLLPLLALIVGVGIGFLIARLLPNAAPNKLQRQVDDMQDRFDSYQREVVTHFSTSASLMKKLTQSYQDVQEHLSEGAWPWTNRPNSACWPPCTPTNTPSAASA